MSKKSRPVICSHCKRRLDDYKSIANAIRLLIADKTDEYAGRTLKRAAELNPLKTARNLGKLVLNFAAEAHFDMSSSRSVLNGAKYPCPHCGVFHEWKRE